MSSIKNQTTQPIRDFPVFNNWDQVALGWYFICPSRELKKSEAKGVRVCGHELVFFRGEDGGVRALDAYCPHMGTHLGKGKVVGNEVRCFFHHWRFNGQGECTLVPCQKEIPEKAKVRAYTVCEKYGAVWVYPDAAPTAPLADFAELAGKELTVVFGKAYERSCHHHVTMINGIDPQHLKTVHGLEIEMGVEIAERANLIDIALTGEIGNTGLEKIAKVFLGPTYSYAMRYDHGNNGLLTLMKNVRFFGRRWPTLHMIFAYRPLEKGRTLVQPIYLTPKRNFVVDSLLLWITKRAFFALQGEDGEVYENMRFYPQNLLSIDLPVAQYIQYVNKLPSSEWKLP